MGEHFLPREDPDAVSVLFGALEREGVEVRLGTTLTRVETLNGAKVLHLETGGESGPLEVDAILVGVGRTPNTTGLDFPSLVPSLV